MASNFVIPIPRGHENHIHYKPQQTVKDILKMLRTRPISTHDDGGFLILKSSVKTNLKRLFKQRKPFPYKKGPLPVYMYAIFNHLQQPVAVVRTKKEALRLLKRDSIRPVIFRKKWKPGPNTHLDPDSNELLAGSTVIQIPSRGGLSIDSDRYKLKPSDQEFGSVYRVATKRCSTCPRANSATEERCGCSLISYIKDQTPGWVYHTDHQLLMQRHRNRKKKENIIKVSIDDLIDDI